MIGENFAMTGFNEEEWADKPVLTAPVLIEKVSFDTRNPSKLLKRPVPSLLRNRLG